MGSSVGDSDVYLRQRRLIPGNAGRFTLAAFTIVLAIKGAFCGWNLGLEHEWINMAVGMCLATLMHFCIVYSACELCCALPFASGPASYAQACLCSPMVGAVTNLYYALSYVFMASALAFFIQDLIVETAPQSENQNSKPLYTTPNAILRFQQLATGFGCIALAVVTQLRPRILLKASIVIAIFAIALLSFVLVSAVICVTTSTSSQLNPPSMILADKKPSFGDHQTLRAILCSDEPSTHKWNGLNPGMPPHAWNAGSGESRMTLKGVLESFPYASWFFLGLEAFFVTAEEMKHIAAAAPSSATCATLIVFVFSVLLFASAPPRQDGFSYTLQPLLWNIRRGTTGTWRAAKLAFVLPVLLAALSAAIYVASRLVYTLSRGGYLPLWLSRTTSRRGAPMFATGASGLLVLIVVSAALAAKPVGPAASKFLLRSCVAYAGVAHALVAILYALLAWRLRTLPRTFRSPLRTVGAFIALVIALGNIIIGPFLLDEGVYTALLLVVPILLAPLYWRLAASSILASIPERIFLQSVTLLIPCLSGY